MNQTGTTLGDPSARTVAMRARWLRSAKKSIISCSVSFGIVCPF
jgi:hypothetical protein